MKKTYIGFYIILLLVTFGFMGCSSNNETVTESKKLSSSNIETAVNTTDLISYYEYTNEDIDTSWNSDDATSIELSNSTAKISGKGAAYEEGTVTITQSGTYVLSGIMEDGQIQINADKTDIVRIVLNNVQLSSSNTSPIYAKKAEKTIIILAEDSENIITDGSQYVFEEEDEPDAAIFAKDDLTITGSGKLMVSGNYRNGIASKDVLCITDGDITVTAAHDGIRGRDGIAILDGNFNIDAKNDGMKSNNDKDSEKGFIAIDGGQFQITVDCDGIQAASSINITGGEYNITTGGGAKNAPQRQNNGGWGRGNQTNNTTEDTESMKALKAGSYLYVEGGTFHINSQDDAVHSNGDMKITGGSFTILTGDDGFHADSDLTIEDGIIDIQNCYEGIEGATVNISGGKIVIKSIDDGINAAGGSDEKSDGPMGGDSFAESSNYYINISGGDITIEADADGLDSNGNLTISGGTIIIHGPTSGGDGALDADGKIEISGGHLVAVGSSGMHEVPDSTSTQASLTVYFTETQSAESTIQLKDSSQTVIAEITTKNSYQAVTFSSPELVKGEVYTVYTNDDKLCDVTLNDISTKVNSDGSEASGGMGGNRPGGMEGKRPDEMEGKRPDGMEGERPDGMEGERSDGKNRPENNGQERNMENTDEPDKI